LLAGVVQKEVRLPVLTSLVTRSASELPSDLSP
jgi:hypothetical protein